MAKIKKTLFIFWREIYISILTQLFNILFFCLICKMHYNKVLLQDVYKRQWQSCALARYRVCSHLTKTSSKGWLNQLFDILRAHYNHIFESISADETWGPPLLRPNRRQNNEPRRVNQTQTTQGQFHLLVRFEDACGILFFVGYLEDNETKRWNQVKTAWLNIKVLGYIYTVQICK